MTDPKDSVSEPKEDVVNNDTHDDATKVVSDADTEALAKTGDETDDSNETKAPDPRQLSNKKQIKEALNRGSDGKKASSLRKKRLRNDLRAEAYHSAKGKSNVPLRLKIMLVLILVTGGMLVYQRGKYTKERRVDNVWEAAKKGDYDSVMRVLNARPEFVDLADGEGNTLMHYAAISGNVGICKAVMELRGRFSRLNAIRRLPIHYAAEYGSFEVAEILLNRNTIVSLPDADGLQPIHLAARNGHAKILDLFREKNPKSLGINAPGAFGMSALHFAAQAGRTEAVKSLLKFRQIKINVLNSHGQTPLHFAVRGGHMDMVKALLDNGADPNYASAGTRSAFDFAKESKNPELLQLLSKSPAAIIRKNAPEETKKDGGQ